MFRLITTYADGEILNSPPVRSLFGIAASLEVWQDDIEQGRDDPEVIPIHWTIISDETPEQARERLKR